MSTENNENNTPVAVPDTDNLPFAEADGDCATFHTAKDARTGAVSGTPAVPAEKIQPVRGDSTRRYASRCRIVLPALPFCALLAGVCWMLTILQGFDDGIGHIRRDCLWFFVMLLPLLGGVLMTGWLALSARRVRQYRLPKTGPGEIFTAFFAAALLGFHALKEIYTLSTTPPAASPLGPDLGMPAAVVLFFCTAYLLMTGLGKRGLAPAWCAMGSVAACMLTLFRDYFDFSLPLNSPLRYMNALTVIAMLLFFLTEARMHTDLWYSSAPFSVLAYGLAIVVGGSAGLGQALLAAMGNPHFSLVREIAVLAIAALSFCRLKSLVTLVGDHMPPPPTEEDIVKAERIAGSRKN